MIRGTGPTSNKFRKYVGNECHVITVGNGAGMVTVAGLKAGEYNEAWTDAEIKEIVAIYEPPKEAKEDAPVSNAKRGPGRPRKVSGPTDPAGEVSEDGSE